MRGRHSRDFAFIGLLMLLCSFKLTNPNNDIVAQIDWDDKKCEITKNHWSVNDYETITPSLISDTGLWSFSQRLKPKIVRIHQASMADSLTSSLTRTWNKDKIRICFEQAAKAFPDAHFLLNPVCNWPEWMHVGGLILNKPQEEEIIRLYRDFALLITELKIPVYAIEIFNERDQVYDNLGKLPQLWNLFNRIHNAILQVNSSIHIAGPALTWPKKYWVESFLDSCGHNTDIFTWHCYVSGNPATTNKEIVKGVNKIDSFANYTQTAIFNRKLSNLRNCISEYNIQWVWEPLEIRHGNSVGAVFQSLMVTKLAQESLDAIMVWHLKGLSYGLINADNTVRTTGYLYLWGNEFLYGNMVETKTSDVRLTLVAVIRPDGTRSILLINKSDDRLTYDLVMNHTGFEIKYSGQLNAENLKPQEIKMEGQKIKLSPWSVTLLSSNTL